MGTSGVPSRDVSTPPLPEPARRSLPAPLVVLLQALATVAVLAGAGALAGLVWFQLWTPPSGTVRSGQWITDETGLRADFAGTGLYVVIAAATGLLVGAVVAIVFDRSELATLLCVLGGAALAGWVMYLVGVHRSPPDPQSVAATAADGTVLPGRLHVSRRTPFVAFPLGALVGYAVLLLVVPKRGLRRRGEAARQRAHAASQSAFQGPGGG